ncbi:MAG TPA: TMEM175 family protein [Nitrososphaerales archaeon]|nr:TMEM175 family protein [Nitrososphaerales archaeon]
MEQQASRPRPRIESLSDLIFGLALSIGAIALIGNPPKQVGDLYTDILGFAFNFLVLISVWMRYTRVMSILPIETRRTSILNTALLFAVSLEPFLFNTFTSVAITSPTSDPLFRVTTALYGADLGTMMLVMGVFTISLADEEKKLVPTDMLRQLRSEALGWFASAALFLVSATPLFNDLVVLGTFVRTDLWLAALILSLVRRGARHIHAHEGGKPSSA